MCAVTAGVMSVTQQLNEIKSLEGKSEKVAKRLISDMKTRVPGWVAAEVAKVYNIKKSEIIPAKVGGSSKAAGSVRVQGESVETMEIVYRGRPLTPIHFGMTPKVPKSTYTLKAEIIKGQKKVLGKKKKLSKKALKNISKNFHREGEKNSPQSPIMLMPMGGTYIPFQRKSQRRNDIEVIKTLSLPQMVSSERTNEAIINAVNEGMEKRLENHLKLLER